MEIGDKMAFNNMGPIRLLNAGQSTYWQYWWSGQDKGTQLATADVKSPNPGSWHIATNEGKRKDNDGSATYEVTITNVGPGSAYHNLQGGGMS
jgi:hypothetical protein